MKPILFSTAMVQALLDGRKTMTRRIVKNIAKPKYEAGDILWVRETFYAYGHWTTITDSDTGKSKKVFQDLTRAQNYLYQYHTDWQPKQAAKFGELGWHKRPSLFMPREACRLFLKVTHVRAERLQDIRERDSIAEGVTRPEHTYLGSLMPNYIHAFKVLWNTINGPQSWDENPWVCVYQFERVSTISESEAEHFNQGG